MYIFGGRDNNRGQYQDLYQLGWCEGEVYWKEIRTTGEDPHFLSGHAAVVVNNTMYVYGGRLGILEGSNKLYALDFPTMRWNVKKT